MISSTNELADKGEQTLRELKMRYANPIINLLKYGYKNPEIRLGVFFKSDVQHIGRMRHMPDEQQNLYLFVQILECLTHDSRITSPKTWNTEVRHGNIMEELYRSCNEDESASRFLGFADYVSLRLPKPSFGEYRASLLAGVLELNRVSKDLSEGSFLRQEVLLERAGGAMFEKFKRNLVAASEGFTTFVKSEECIALCQHKSSAKAR